MELLSVSSILGSNYQYAWKRGGALEAFAESFFHKFFNSSRSRVPRFLPKLSRRKSLNISGLRLLIKPLHSLLSCRSKQSYLRFYGTIRAWPKIDVWRWKSQLPSILYLAQCYAHPWHWALRHHNCPIWVWQTALMNPSLECRATIL